MIFAIMIGVLYTAGLYMMMRRSIVKVLLGLALLGHSANLLIFAIGRPERASAPIVPPGSESLLEPYADPLPQALILTAIVIGFAVQAFAIVLVKRVYQVVGTDDIDNLRSTDT